MHVDEFVRGEGNFVATAFVPTAVQVGLVHPLKSDLVAVGDQR
jgi:hypothetical protein